MELLPSVLFRKHLMLLYWLGLNIAKKVLMSRVVSRGLDSHYLGMQRIVRRGALSTAYIPTQNIYRSKFIHPLDYPAIFELMDREVPTLQMRQYGGFVS